MKTPAVESVFDKVADLQIYKKETPTQVISYEHCKNF